MRILVPILALGIQAGAQTATSAFPNADAIGWRVAAEDSGPATADGLIARAGRIGTRFLVVSSQQVPVNSTDATIATIRGDLDRRQLSAAAYRLSAVPASQTEWGRALDVAAKLGASVVLVPAQARPAAATESLAAQRNLKLAIDVSAGAQLSPEAAAATVAGLGKQVGIWTNPAAWQKAGFSPLAAMAMLRDRLAGGSLDGSPASEEFLKEAYRLDLRPLLWTVSPEDSAKTAQTVQALVSYHQSYASRTAGVRRLAQPNAEERQRVEAACPATAPAAPRKPRKLLVFDLNVGRLGHPSIPYANLAMQVMGRKTGAFEATVSSDPAMLEPSKLREFDAVYLNNTIGDIFATKQARDGFAEFLANGGGLVANHAVTVTATGWSEFGQILGARGASHRMTDEKVFIRIEDPANPIVKIFDGQPFEYSDEIFRFQNPYSRDNVRVLLSVDPIRTDMNQGRCFGQCLRDDNDYPVAWIRQYGKGRVFYTTLGHNSHVFWDPKMLEFFLAAVQYALGDLPANAMPRARSDSALDSALAALATYDWGQDQAPLRNFEREMALLGPSREAAREVEGKMLRTLQGNATLAAKDAICRQLAVIGTADSVPVLAAMLTGKETAGMARYALERIDSASATAALRDALPKADPITQTGVINSLARRRDAAAVPALERLSESPDKSVAVAAINALGMIGTPEAEAALLNAKLTPGTADALLTLAENSPPPRAMEIYSKLSGTAAPEEARTASMHGIARVAGREAIVPLSSALRDPSPDVQTAAIVELAALDAKSLVSAFPQLSPAAKIQTLNSLAARADKSGLPLMLDAVRADDESVRVAALRGFAETGSAAQVPMLVATAASTTGGEQSAARYSLTRIPGAEADKAIADAIPGAAPKAKVELIRAAGVRGASNAAPALLATARDSDPEIRRESIGALREVAVPGDTPGLLDLLLQSSDDDPKECERALAAAIRRAERPDIGPIVAAYQSAKDSRALASLVSVMAMTGAPEALPVIRQALDNGDAEVQRAAVNGLAEWPTPDPLTDLLRVAQTSANPALRVLALRGYIRLAQLPVGRAPSDTAKLLGMALELASRPEEKKAVLAALQRVVSPESLQLVQSVSDPAVAAEAKTAASALERALAARRN